MTNSERKPGSARLQLALIASLFFGPLLVAAWMYYGGSFTPTARSNHGLVLDPILHLPDSYPVLQEVAKGQWLLVYVNESTCDSACDTALHTLRQSRLMLGNDMNRLTRVFLHGRIAPDSVLAQEQNVGLKSLHVESLDQDLWSSIPAGISQGGFFLIDPLGNLVMYFQPNLSPREMIDDIKHLLRLSQIG